MPRQATKKKLIEEAAIRLFATKGLSSTTVRDIAQAAGVTDGALYRHYPSKNDMARQLFSRELETFCGQLDEIMFDRERDVTARLSDSVRFILAYYAAHPIHFAFIMFSQHGFPEEQNLPETLNPFSMAARFIAEGMELGEIPEQDALVSGAMLMGLVLQPMVYNQQQRLTITDEGVEEMVQAARRLVAIAP